MRADADVLMHRTHCAHHSPILDRHVAAESGGISQDHAIPNYTIMRNVGVRHVQVVVAHAGDTTAFYRTPIDGDKFADLVVVADFQLSRLAGASDVLRRQSDG